MFSIFNRKSTYRNINVPNSWNNDIEHFIWMNHVVFVKCCKMFNNLRKRDTKQCTIVDIARSLDE